MQPAAPDDDKPAPLFDTKALLESTYGKRAVSYAERATALIDRTSAYLAPKSEIDDQAPENIAHRSIKLGMWIFVLVFGVFGLWATFAPLKSAAVTTGSIVLDSNRKTIQHLEGGIVKEILVSEGAEVKEGEPLLRLDETAAKARLDLFKSQYINAITTEARLKAERDNKSDITFPEELQRLESQSPTIAASLDSQRRLFTSRRDANDGQIKLLSKKIDQFKEEIIGLEAQTASADEQMKLLSEEISVVRKLLKTGNAVKPRLLALERNFAQIQGQRGENMARISRAQQNIAEAEITMINTRNNFLREVVQELKATQVEISDLEERIRSAADIMNRIVIRSPISGTITGLSVHTVGGVITPGEKLMDIVPFDDKLIVETKVTPTDIDTVRAGLKATVRLTAYKARKVPPLEGQVVTVSADAFQDQRTGMSFYTARIEIPQKELDDLDDDVELTPGMPADALIITGSRTLLSYMWSPISDTFYRAFREQ